MQIVIDVNDELVEYFASHNSMMDDGWFSHSSQLLNAFRKGTSLPKGHGDLIDRSKLEVHYVGTDIGTDCPVYLSPTVEEAPTIIAADKENE